MKDEDEKIKLAVINRWECYEEDKLKALFSYYLYPLTQWYRGKDGIGYSSSRIKQFKGLKKEVAYDYILYHKVAHFFVSVERSECIGLLLYKKDWSENHFLLLGLYSV